MQHYGQRVFFFAQAAHQVISDAGTEGSGDPGDQKKRGNSRIELLDQQNNAKGHRVKKPLRQFNTFLQHKDRDDGGKNGRKILDGHRSREWNMLERVKEKIERSGAKKSAQQKQLAVRPFPIDAGA